MKTAFRRILIFTLTCGLLLAVYFEPTHCVRGWLWGEAFFDGRPTSYWRAVVINDLQFDPRRFVDPLVVRPTVWSEFQDWIGYTPRRDTSMTFIGNQDAGPVLRELAADDNEHVAALALEIWTLNKLNPDIGNRPLEWSMFPTYWQRLICKHNIKHKGIEKLLD